MTEIIPAILAKNFDEIEVTIEKVRGLVPMVQIDICDGVFVSNQTWPYRDGTDPSWQAILAEQEGMPYWDEIDFELDLMVAHVDKRLADLIKIGPSRIVFHIESLENPNSFFDHLDPYIKETIEIGVAINTTTPIEELWDLLDKKQVSFVQCMGIEKIGYQGQPFDERVISQITALRARYSDLPIAVDGAVSLETARELVARGATRLVIGSALLESEDIHTTLEEFKNLAE